jgi:sugar/nucleoside kinase (ribokinase family)
MFDLVTVGHLAIDRIFSPKTVALKPTLGGPPTYVSLSARRLGAEVSVISKVGGDFPEGYVTWLGANGVDVSGLKRVEGALTTRFILRYEDGERKLQVVSRAPSIFPEDIPPNLQAKAVHVAPIINEVLPETVGKLRKMVGVLSLDPQGFVRQIDEKGNVGLRRWTNP